MSVIRQKGESQNWCFRKTKHAKFSEKRTFFYPLIRAYQGVKKCSFFGKFGVLGFPETPVLRFALLPYYRQFTSRKFCNSTLFGNSFQRNFMSLLKLVNWFWFVNLHLYYWTVDWENFPIRLKMICLLFSTMNWRFFAVVPIRKLIFLNYFCCELKPSKLFLEKFCSTIISTGYCLHDLYSLFFDVFVYLAI